MLWLGATEAEIPVVVARCIGSLFAKACRCCGWVQPRPKSQLSYIILLLWLGATDAEISVVVARCVGSLFAKACRCCGWVQPMPKSQLSLLVVLVVISPRRADALLAVPGREEGGGHLQMQGLKGRHARKLACEPHIDGRYASLSRSVVVAIVLVVVAINCNCNSIHR